MGSPQVRDLTSGHYILADSTPRMILAGLGAIVLIEIYAAVMQREFQHTENRIGKGFAILGIYLFVVFYCEYIFA